MLSGHERQRDRYYEQYVVILLIEPNDMLARASSGERSKTGGRSA